eukprot:CAMPEP_0195069410 /NCGR_PEP_ID=MMETSP0448-20130528/13724_1 /TAXON_ID=66468 /ORGANISM="Heterocapsa triquestra, Strain CCMP 448" /LENGTH=69 /DNA_ID=CAMNT_0040101009 /DNA_START=32 /DNA_END=237 /DNA_ORIENTATION=-
MSHSVFLKGHELDGVPACVDAVLEDNVESEGEAQVLEFASMLVDAAQACGLQRPGAGRDIVVSATLGEA